MTAALDFSTLARREDAAAEPVHRSAPPAGTVQEVFLLPEPRCPQPGLGAGRDDTAETSCPSDLTRVHADCKSRGSGKMGGRTVENK